MTINTTQHSDTQRSPVGPEVPLQPYSEAAEQAVLSAMICEPGVIPAVSKTLNSESFFNGAHRRIFDAMTALHARDVAVDPLTVVSELERADALDATGGREYLAYLIEVVPSAANVEHHARIVRRHAQRRQLIKAADTTRMMALREDAEPDEIARQMQAAALPIAVDDEHGGFREVLWSDITQLAEVIASRGEAVESGRLPGIATGYHEIDSVTQGFRKKEFVLFGAVPKSWKTALTDNILINMIRDGRLVGKVAAEMTREETEERMIAAGARIPHAALGRGQLSSDDWTRFFATGRELERRIHIDDEAFPELGDVIARCTDLKARVPALEVITVDYLQLVTSHERGRRGDEEIQLVCRALKGLAKRLDVVMIAPAQANYKEVDNRPDKRPQARDLQGSSGMAQTPNFIAMLYWDRLYNVHAEPILEVNFVYSRRTPPFLAKLQAHPEYQLLTNRRPPATRAERTYRAPLASI